MTAKDGKEDDYANKEPEPMPGLTFDVDPKDVPSYVYPAQNHKEYLYDISVMGDAEFAAKLAEGRAQLELVEARRQAFLNELIPPEPPAKTTVKETPQVVLPTTYTPPIEKVITPLVEYQAPPRPSLTMPNNEPPYYSNTMKYEYTSTLDDSERLGKVTRTEKIPVYVAPPSHKVQKDGHRSTNKVKTVVIIIIVLMAVTFLLCIGWLFKVYFIDMLSNKKTSSAIIN